MSVMLTKFESKSNRVKGDFERLQYAMLSLKSRNQGLLFIQLSLFSRHRCTMVVSSCGIIVWVSWWIGLRSMKVKNSVQINICVHYSEPFTGPVRGVAIHPSRALLATGGDDYKIKVWGE